MVFSSAAHLMRKMMKLQWGKDELISIPFRSLTDDFDNANDDDISLAIPLQHCMQWRSDGNTPQIIARMCKLCLHCLLVGLA